MSRKSIAFAAALLAWGVGLGGTLQNAVAQEAAEKSPSKPLLQIRGESAAEKNIEVALYERTNLEFTEVPLKEALKYIADKHKIDIQYDIVALRDAAIDPTAIPVTLNVRGVHLQSALNRILAQHNLTYIIQDEVLQITTKDKANTTLTTVVYDVQELVGAQDKGRPDFARLIKLIASVVEPQTWAEVGGPGTVTGFGAGTLVVSQTRVAQESLADLLRTVRGVAEEVRSGKARDWVLIGRDWRDERIDQWLAEKRSLNVKDKSLNEVIAELLPARKGNVGFDSVALRDAAVDPTAIPVELDVKDIALRSILKLVLSQNNLTYVFDDEMLLITTRDKANTTIVNRVYPVSDLLKLSPTDDSFPEDVQAQLEQLLKTITDTIAAQTWNEVGGPGVIEAFNKDGYMLAVSQTHEVHDEIYDLLKNLRTMHKQQLDVAAQETAQAKTPETVVLKVYDLKVSAPNAPAMTPQEVMEVVKGLTDTKAWSTPEAYIRGATGKLIVKQTPSVHRQIEKLLDQLGAAVPKMPTNGNRTGTGFGGGGGGF